MTTMPTNTKTSHLYVVYVNLVLYSVCYMMQQPVLPFLTDKLGASTAQFASLQSLFNGAQAVGGLLSGPVLDAFGGKVLLLISFAASFVCYGLTASATTLVVLYISRVATVLQHAVLAGRTIVAASTGESDRAKHLGYVGMCIGVGMSSGPVIGGLMSDVSLQFSAWMATAGSLLSFLMILIFVPSDAPLSKSSAKPEADGRVSNGSDGTTTVQPVADPLQDHTQSKDPASKAPAPSSVWGVGQFVDVLSAPGVAHLFVVKLISNLASSLFQSMFTVVLKAQGMGPKHVGAAMSFIGVCSIVVQAVLVAPAIKHLGESRTLYVSCWGLLVSFLMLAGAKGFIPTMVSLVPQCIAGVLLSAVSTSRLTKVVPKARTGSALALDMGLWSAVRMATPGIGAWLLATTGPPGIGSAAAALMACLLAAVHLGLVIC